MNSFRKLVKNRAAPLIAVVAGSGQVARVAVESGADMIMVLNTGVFRHLGISSMACFMPYGNANDQIEELLRYQILPATPNIPIITGLLAHDPIQSMEMRLKRLKSWGVEAITNFPTLGFYDESIRKSLEMEGIELESELELLRKAKEMGFVTFGFSLNREDTERIVSCKVDGLILHIGVTQEFEDTVEKKNQVQLGITKAKQILQVVPSGENQPLSLIHGGTITRPEDFEEICRQIPVHGFAGGSVFERIPVTEGVESSVRKFKSILFSSDSPGYEQDFGSMVGVSPPMKSLYKLIRQIAPYDVNVMIEGKSGTGKELVATQIHRLSPRSNQPFVTTNCGAIPDTLVESEFFGYEKGSFTGATQRRLGKFQLAHHGTLFLDEVADLSPHAQVALLRVLQQGEIIRIGGQNPIPVDVRIIAASNQSLEKRVEEGKFRSDLYFRLSGMIVQVPPLEERKGDIPLLVRNILSRLSSKLDKRLNWISEDFLKQLNEHYWPGNVRELEHVMTRAAILESGPILQGNSFQPSKEPQSKSLLFPQGEEEALAHLLKYILTSKGRETKSDWREEVEENKESRDIKDLSLSEFRYEKAQKALLESAGNKTVAARALGISRKALYTWLRK